jgi:hypothetical protein
MISSRGTIKEPGDKLTHERKHRAHDRKYDFPDPPQNECRTEHDQCRRGHGEKADETAYKGDEASDEKRNRRDADSEYCSEYGDNHSDKTGNRGQCQGGRENRQQDEPDRGQSFPRTA